MGKCGNVEVPTNVTDGISRWFSERKGHKKARNIKSIKRRFIKKYGKDAGCFFDHVCCDINIWK